MRFASLAGGLLAALGAIAQAAEGDGLVVTGDGVNVRAQPRSGAPILLQVHRPEPAVEVAREGDWVRVQLPDHNTVGWIHSSLLAAAEGATPPRVAGDRAAASPTAPPAETTPSDGAGGTTPAAAAPTAESTASGPAGAPVPAAETNASAGAGSAAAESAQPGAPQVTAVDVSATEALARFRAGVESLNSGAVAAAGVNLFGDVRLASEDVAQVTAAEAWHMVPEGGRQSYLNILHDQWAAIVGSAPASVQIVDQSGRVLSERGGP